MDQFSQSQSEMTAPAVPTSSRIPGVDIARSVAIIGMMMAHLSHFLPESTWMGTFLHSMDGRSSTLFVLLSGVGVALLMQRRPGYETSMRIWMRGGMLFIIGGLMAVTSAFVSVILYYYLAYMVLAWLAAKMPTKVLAVCVGLALILGPIGLEAYRVNVKHLDRGQGTPTVSADNPADANTADANPADADANTADADPTDSTPADADANTDANTADADGTTSQTPDGTTHDVDMTGGAIDETVPTHRVLDALVNATGPLSDEQTKAIQTYIETNPQMSLDDADTLTALLAAPKPLTEAQIADVNKISKYMAEVESALNPGGAIEPEDAQADDTQSTDTDSTTDSTTDTATDSQGDDLDGGVSVEEFSPDQILEESTFAVDHWWQLFYMAPLAIILTILVDGTYPILEMGSAVMLGVLLVKIGLDQRKYMLSMAIGSTIIASIIAIIGWVTGLSNPLDPGFNPQTLGLWSFEAHSGALVATIAQTSTACAITCWLVLAFQTSARGLKVFADFGTLSLTIYILHAFWVNANYSIIMMNSLVNTGSLSLGEAASLNPNYVFGHVVVMVLVFMGLSILIKSRFRRGPFEYLVDMPWMAWHRRRVAKAAAAQPGYPAPGMQPGYPAPGMQPGYQASQPGYQAPQPGFQAPQPGFQAPPAPPAPYPTPSSDMNQPSNESPWR